MVIASVKEGLFILQCVSQELPESSGSLTFDQAEMGLAVRYGF